MVWQRVLEVEVMDTADDASEYDALDHQAVNAAFVADFTAVLAADGKLGEILDLGTGTGLIPLELCRTRPDCRVRAVDMSREMLKLAEAHIGRADLQRQIICERVDAKLLPYKDEQFSAVVSNSLIHHLPEPAAVFREAARVTAVGGTLFFRDLVRPDDQAALDRLMVQYAAAATFPQRKMFADSLRAALTLDEIRDRVEQLGFPRASVQTTSDRHWTWSAVRTSAR